MSVSDRMSVERIVIELESPGDSRSLFRLRLDNKVVGESLTAVQAHLLCGRNSRPDHTAAAFYKGLRARLGPRDLLSRSRFRSRRSSAHPAALLQVVSGT
jgi:hypothetical protein